MTTMCNACNDGQKVLGCGVDCKGCSASFCVEFDKRVFTLAIDVKHQMHSLASRSDKHAMDQHSTTELISKTKTPTCSCPAHLLLDASNSASDCGNSISEMNLHSRENGDEAVDIHLEQSKRSNKHEVTGSKVFSEIFSAPTSDFTTGLDRIGEATVSGETFRSRTLALESQENGKDERLLHANNTQGDLRSASLRTGDDLDKVENGVTSISLVLPFLRTDPLIWKPPEAANIEDDLDSVANNDDDDDDDYSDGTKWGQSSSLGDFDKLHGNRYKEVRQKAMVAAMNGQFKILVSRFLASEGLASMDEGHVIGWLDIVTSLSWEAALFIKPDAKEGRAMDPGSYVKVKCAATGARNQSEVIKGLIFKKNAAHKHMPIKCKNPRLLLIKGVLGQRELGLSSFDSMDQEKDYLKSINEMIEACHPNLVLVEKSVSRDIQEFLLAKGMTLVYDMKIARLERIARCTGSQIIPSANILTNRNITQCDSFHIEKLMEEHNTTTEVGKRTTKTLMFLEGFSKPLGCTILLKGAHIDELKRVKRVLQYTIFAAYHLILETSFFADQRALFSNTDSSEGNDTLADKVVPIIPAPSSIFSDSSASNSFLENSAHEGFSTMHLDASRSSDYGGFTGDIDFCEDNFAQGHYPRSLSNEIAVNQSSLLSSSDRSVQLMPSFSASLGKLASGKFSPFLSEPISSYCGFKNQEHDYPSLNGRPIDSSFGTIVNGIEANENIMEEMPNCERPETFSVSNEPVQYSTAVTTNKIEIEGKDDSDGVLSSESILVLLSSQSIEKGLFCEQSHLSRIKYYGNFDVSLGRYLQDVLLNQKHSCSLCGEPPEAHIYCFTHQNGNLTVLVKQLSSTSSLLGETEGKIWMWSRCLKCEHENGIPRSTKRVVMSTAARSLSFGKFLELSFTSHSAASRLSSECGHSLHRDCLRFFGLGSKVAMFRYSPVEIYAACKPPPLLEFTIPSGQDWIMLETNSVLQRGEIFFSEVANFLENLKISSRPFSEEYKNFPGFVKSISEAEDMLIKEKAEFKAALFKAVNCTGQVEKAVNEIIGLSWFNQELILGLYIWDRRLHQLSQISKDLDRSRDENEGYMGKTNIEIGDVVSGTPNHIPITVQRSTSDSSYNDQNHYYREPDAAYNSSKISQCSGSDEMECSIEAASFDQSAAENAPTTVYQNALSTSPDNSSTKDYEEECATAFYPMHEVLSMGPSGHSDISDLEMKNDNTINGIGLFFNSALKGQQSSGRGSPIPDFEDPESLIWIPFNDLRIAFKNDLYGGYLHKFSFIRTYTPKYLSPMHQLFTQERGLLHYPVGTGRKIMSACEDEISSIIACALALSEDQNCLLESVDMKNSFEGKMEADKEIDNPSNLASEGSLTSFYWSSNNGSLESLGMHFSRSFSSLSSDESSSLAIESALSTDRLITSENLHPEVPLGIGKEGFKKYSVVCIHAKQFYALRRMCCPSEQAYISSLSRCRKWDAQGGKSKAFFAKSMDDRFIIKQIKRAELDSFLKFASDYFKHITHSLSTGSQTCLAKILGIYQVRLTKSGKEVKIDLMVMENLLFGHNVSRTYDLKGAVFSRYISDINDSEKVLLDQNFVEDMRLSPIYIGGKTKHLLQRAIWNDTSFLSAINVMDYSLLVGVDKKQQQLVFGIIDYLRQYTWDKQLETWVKASLVVPKNSLPTIISPKEYKKRFRKFMSRYFLTVPDSWCSTECSEPCKFCTGRCSCLSGSHGLEPSQRDI